MCPAKSPPSRARPADAAGPARDRLLMAQIGAAHGIKGEVRVKPFGEDPMALGSYGPLETEDGSQRFEVETLRAQKAMLVIRFKGIRDRNAAEALNGIKLYVARDVLPEPQDEDTFYQADLIGLDAVDTRGAALGTVVSVQDFGAGDLLEIAPSGGRSYYVPFTLEVVPEVDLDAGRVVVDPPEGLMADAERDKAEARAEAEAQAEANKGGDTPPEA